MDEPAKPDAASDGPDGPPEPQAPKVVSLDQFRKK